MARPSEAPLTRLSRVVRIEHPPLKPAGRENQPPPPEATMTPERASLLSFIAGEVRRR